MNEPLPTLNIIVQKAPGTGKTHLSKLLASAMDTLFGRGTSYLISRPLRFGDYALHTFLQLTLAIMEALSKNQTVFLDISGYDFETFLDLSTLDQNGDLYGGKGPPVAIHIPITKLTKSTVFIQRILNHYDCDNVSTIVWENHFFGPVKMKGDFLSYL